MSKVISWIKPYPELALYGDGVFFKSCSKTMGTNPEHPAQHPSAPPQSMPLMPIVNQPSNQRNTSKLPSGLEYLRTVDQLLVKQKVESFEACCGYESSNKFEVLNTSGQTVYSALEESDSCERNCFGSCRSLDLNIVDNYGNVVMTFYRSDYQTMQIQAPPGRLVGVAQRQSLIAASFNIQNAHGQTVLRAEGPLYTGSLGGNVEFKILKDDGNTQIGSISKQWGGMLTEMYTDADSFKISFPIDLNITLKASLLGTLFLIDMIYYENNR